METTELPVYLWLNQINRKGRAFISNETIKDIDMNDLDEFIRSHNLRMISADGGIVVKRKI